jgi:hypothetical protein
MALGIAQLAVVVDAAGEEVVEQALLDLLQLGDDLLGLADGVVDGVEDRGDLALLAELRDGTRTARSADSSATARPVCSRVALRLDLSGPRRS